MLEVRRDEQVVAHLHKKRHGSVDCVYSEETLALVPGGTPLLSCSLPVRSMAQDATGWARGLLSEGRHLSILAAEADVSRNDTYGLLARFGRDIAGAFEIVPSEPPPRTPTYEVYTDLTLADEIANIDVHPLGIHEDSELSIAGLQDKLLVVRTPDGVWARPRFGYPSTHIIKLDHRTHTGLTDAEAACLDLARRVGLNTFESWTETIGGQRVMIVARFDREVHDGRVHRDHQEDLLQALNVVPEDRRGRAKYQAANSIGPPSWWHLAELLDDYSSTPEEDRRRLLAAVVFNLVIGNADSHAKNLALVLEDGAVYLAPLYDVVPTTLWPTLRPTMAFTIADKSEPASVTVQDILTEAKRWRLGTRTAAATVADTLTHLHEAVDSLDHEEVAALVKRNIERLQLGRGSHG